MVLIADLPSFSGMATMNALRIPILSTTQGQESVVVFPDEVPTGASQDLNIIDVLRGELAPLSIWRECAVSVFIRGDGNNFSRARPRA